MEESDIFKIKDVDDEQIIEISYCVSEGMNDVVWFRHQATEDENNIHSLHKADQLARS